VALLIDLDVGRRYVLPGPRLPSRRQGMAAVGGAQTRGNSESTCGIRQGLAPPPSLFDRCIEFSGGTTRMDDVTTGLNGRRLYRVTLINRDDVFRPTLRHRGRRGLCIRSADSGFDNRIVPQIGHFIYESLFALIVQQHKYNQYSNADTMQMLPASTICRLVLSIAESR